ncbi:MAG: OmpA family protein [Candidatus Gastranaerophilales bacterium]|nr:OmpA family protein [Candidatus Gastranaerophilales bacterium]
MAKKKKPEEHVNLERWLVSYGDFMTLLLATFVVLYALAQSDVAAYTKLQDALNDAFKPPSIIQGDEGILNDSGSSVLSNGYETESSQVIPPMLEQVSAKYEETSFLEIQNAVNQMKANGEIDGIDVEIGKRGLTVKLKDLDLFFNSGTAEIKKESYPTLEKIAKLIDSKFKGHFLRVEGHTDDIKIKSSIFPSNWELSSARASSVVRFLIDKFNFEKKRFAAVGYADSRLIAPNTTQEDREKNRRVEIIILRNSLLESEDITKDELYKKQREEITKKQKEELQKYKSASNAAKDLAKKIGISLSNILILRDNYEEKAKNALDELERIEQEKRKKLKLPDKKLEEVIPLSTEEQKKVEEDLKKGKISAAVANLLKERGETSTIIVKEGEKNE